MGLAYAALKHKSKKTKLLESKSLVKKHWKLACEVHGGDAGARRAGAHGPEMHLTLVFVTFFHSDILLQNALLYHTSDVPISSLKSMQQALAFSQTCTPGVRVSADWHSAKV